MSPTDIIPNVQEANLYSWSHRSHFWLDNSKFMLIGRCHGRHFGWQQANEWTHGEFPSKEDWHRPTSTGRVSSSSHYHLIIISLFLEAIVKFCPSSGLTKLMTSCIPSSIWNRKTNSCCSRSLGKWCGLHQIFSLPADFPAWLNAFYWCIAGRFAERGVWDSPSAERCSPSENRRADWAHWAGVGPDHRAGSGESSTQWRLAQGQTWTPAKSLWYLFSTVSCAAVVLHWQKKS